MNVIVIKYNAGNIQSVLYALERINVLGVVTDDPARIHSADKVIFPGVGEASSAMRYLKERGLDKVITSLKQPVLGICLGMQLMCKHSAENDTDCLAIFNEEIKKFSLPFPDQSNGASKIPQVGWNTIHELKSDLFLDIDEHTFVYSVHSYYASLGAHTIATMDYMGKYSAALKKDNFYGVQFHPEKSAGAGERILKNFINECE